MQTFFISFRRRDQKSNKAVLTKDDVWIDLPGLEEAKMLASAFARDLLSANIKWPSDCPIEAVIVTNGAGRELMTILTKDILAKPFCTDTTQPR